MDNGPEFRAGSAHALSSVGSAFEASGKTDHAQRGMDPTRGIFCDNTYVPVAHAAVAESINPIQGSFFSAIPATSTMTTRVRVWQGG